MAQLRAMTEASGTGSADPEYIRYTVVPGDTLAGICAQNGIDYEANIGTIMKINGMDNADLIVVGQTILLPSGK